MIPKKNRPTKEQMYMNIAKMVSARSTCKRLAVGAIITDRDMRNIRSMGYNGNVKDGPNTCDSDEPGACGCIHAELNALLKIVNEPGQIMFVTDSPCLHCAKLLINSGFEEVFYRYEYRKKEGVELLKRHNIKVLKI